MSNLPDVLLRDYKGPPNYSSCPDVFINGFRVPELLRVQTDMPFDGVAHVTVTFLAKIRRGPAE